MSNASENPGQRRPTRNEVDQLCRSTRKKRSIQACYPCRSRKVKCDYSRPCGRCVERKHENLCTFVPDEQALDTTVATTTTINLLGQENELPPGKRPRYEALTPGIISQSASIRQTHELQDGSSLVTTGQQQGTEPNYGPNSIASFVLNEVKKSSPLPEQVMMKNVILPMLGLQNPPIRSYTYPSSFLYVQKELKEYLPNPKEIME